MAHNVGVNIGVNTRRPAVAVMPKPNLWGASDVSRWRTTCRLFETDTRCPRVGSLGVLFSALLALALFDPGAATAQEVKQIKLTEKHIQGFMAAYKDMARLYDGADPDKPDPKVDAQAAAVAKKNGFASLAEYDGVSMNISMIMFGIDPQTKKFTEPPDQIKKQIAALKTDKSVSEAEKKEELAELEAALKNAKPIQFKENVALVLKYFDKLAPLMQEQDFEPATCGLKGNSGAAEHYPQKQDPANCGVLPFSDRTAGIGGSGPIHARLLIVGRASFGEVQRSLAGLRVIHM